MNPLQDVGEKSEKSVGGNNSTTASGDVELEIVHSVETSESRSSTDTGQRQSSLENFSGYLNKKTKDGRWQKRWFESNGHFLAYYKSKKKERLLAALSLPQTGEIRLITENTTGTTTGTGRQIGLFSIELNSRIYILQARTDEEAEKWVLTLNNLKYQGHPNLRSSGSGVVMATKSRSEKDKSGNNYRDLNDLLSRSLSGEGSGESGSATWAKSDRGCYGWLMSTFKCFK